MAMLSQDLNKRNFFSFFEIFMSTRRWFGLKGLEYHSDQIDFFCTDETKFRLNGHPIYPSPPGTVTVGTTSTLAPGSSASVNNSGTPSAAILNFGIPSGLTGSSGTVAIGTTTTLAAGSPATVTNSGTPSAAVLNFGVPQGIQGVPPASSPITNIPCVAMNMAANTLTQLHFTPGTYNGYVVGATSIGIGPGDFLIEFGVQAQNCNALISTPVLSVDGGAEADSRNITPVASRPGTTAGDIQQMFMFSSSTNQSLSFQFEGSAVGAGNITSTAIGFRIKQIY